jgi:hypothetical protein
MPYIKEFWKESIIFWDMTPCSPLVAEPTSLTLKMEAIRTSETSVETQQTTRRHIPENDTLHNHRCENLKSYTILKGFSVFQERKECDKSYCI